MSLYHIRRLRPTTWLLIAGAVALGGCQSTPTVAPQVPAPSLKLVESRPLAMAADCEASGSYFVGFTVLSDGRTADIEAPAGPPCVQQALSSWVSSFKYAPPGRQTPAGVEWMMVTARRGS